MKSNIPGGFRMAGVHCGIKSDATREDLSLFVCDCPCVGAGVYTQNRVIAAPVKIDRARTPGKNFRAVVINSGNANACTGQRGLEDGRRMCELAAKACDARGEEVLVLSTGIIGKYLPMDTIASGIEQAASRLACDEEALGSAARGMMTTDTAPKIATRNVELGGKAVQITGLAKGAAMIGPNMATMLAVILTDAALPPDVAQSILGFAVDVTFNSISVDGHTSTNDTVLLLASGVAGPLAGTEIDRFAESVREVCQELALAIVADGEGTSHVISIEVSGCADTPSARQIATSIAESPLVKAAVAGGDPNWGRIVSAAGYSGVPFDPDGVELLLNGTRLFVGGSPVAFDEAAVSASIRGSRDTRIELRFSEGDAQSRFYTADLTEEYVRLNADYHT